MVSPMRKSSVVLKPQDVVTLLKVYFYEDNWTFSALSQSLAVSASEVHSSLERSAHARLYNRTNRSINRPDLLTFLIHGIRYAFPAHPGPIKRGIPTAWSVPPLLRQLPLSGLPHVWPSTLGTTDGIAIAPLYRSVPQATQSDRQLYRALAVVDALRIGSPNEHQAAALALKNMLQADKTEEAQPPPAPSRPAQNEVIKNTERNFKPTEQAELSPNQRLLIEKIRVLTGTRTQKLYESEHMESVVIQLDQDPDALQQLVHISPDTRPEIQLWARELLKNPEHRFIMKEHLPRRGDTSARLRRIRDALRSMSETA